MGLEPLNLDRLSQPAPRPAQQVNHSPLPAERRPWLAIGLLSVIAFLVAMLIFGRGSSPGPAPGPDIDVSGQYVLFVVDEGSTNGIAADQAAVTNSAKVADWCDANGVEFRRYDVEDDLRLEEPVWQELAKLVDRPPAMVTLRDKKATVRDFPASVDDAIDQLSGVFE